MKEAVPNPRLLLALLLVWVAGLSQIVAVLSRNNPPRRSEESILLVGVVYGAVSAAVSLSAWWLTLVRKRRPQRELSRHVLIIGLILWLGLSWQVAPTLADPVDERTVADTLSIAWGYQWVAVGAVLWLARHYWGWQVRNAQRPRDGAATDTVSRQFSIRSILFITAVIAVALAISRATMFGSVEHAQTHAWPIVRTMLFCVVGGVCQAAVAVAAVWLIAVGGAWWRIPLCVAIVAAAWGVQSLVYTLATGTTRYNDVALTVAANAGVHFLVLVVGLVTLHATGYRLRRRTT